MPLVGDRPEVADDPRVSVMLPPWDVKTVKDLAARPPTGIELDVLTREVDAYRRVVRGGGRLVLGTDAPLSPVGLHLHIAMRALHRHGFGTAEVLTTATRTPAEVFGVADHLGTVEEGKIADLTVVDGDPFTDFDDLIRITSVLRAGTLHERAALEKAFAHPRPRMSPRGGWAAAGEQMVRDGCCEVRHR